jgi:hypothetical protein
MTPAAPACGSRHADRAALAHAARRGASLAPGRAGRNRVGKLREVLRDPALWLIATGLLLFAMSAHAANDRDWLGAASRQAIDLAKARSTIPGGVPCAEARPCRTEWDLGKERS